MSNYQYPKSAIEWWANVNTYWASLESLIRAWAPNLLADAIECRESKNPDLVDVLQTVWNNAPDTPGLHDIPGWNVLCDLCSEQYVLQE